MADSEQTSPTDSKELQEIFVSVTGETVVTLPQDQGPGRGVINTTHAGSSSDPDQFRSDPAADALEDAIGQPESR
jgi:hypothetical protein